MLLVGSFLTSAKAQMLTAENTLLMLSTGSQLTVKGDVLLKAGTTITSNGTIDLIGNWINNCGTPAFTNSSGTVIMNGFNQYIGGFSPTVFFNLNLFNGTKTLLVNSTSGGHISSPIGSLNCNNAILNLKSHVFRINNFNPTGITRTTGYILGEDADYSSKVWWAFLAQGLHTIPFGNAAGADISFSLLLVGTTGGYTSDMIVSTYATAPNNTPLPITPLWLRM
ncbi:MAG: hypothetical protein IPP71_09760 [Bacteroidetes bacterium]|nr:hypothetical protein [Bacteroidota bacterium]